MWTVSSTVALMRAQSRLSSRLALAIAHLDQEWERLDPPCRHRDSYDPNLKKAREPLRRLLQSEDLFSPLPRADRVNRLSEAWLKSVRVPDLLSLLAYVVEVDQALEPDAAVSRRLSFLRSRHRLPPELGNQIWTMDGPPPLAREITNILDRERKRAGRRGLTHLADYQPRLADLLSCVRYSRFPIEWVEPPPHVQARFDEVWAEVSREKDDLPIRIGLFSLRGVKTRFEYTRCFAPKKHGFRASGIQPRKKYLSRLDRIIEEVSKPERGVHILLLPELMVSSEGLERLTDRLAAMASRADSKPPLLTIAGSFHLQHGDKKSWSNVCTVLDHTGRILWRQQKRIPFPWQGPAQSWLRGCPPNLGPDEVYLEDIQPAQSTCLARSPLGWLAVAICSDVVPSATGEVSRWARLPLDWILIPSMSGPTEQFWEASRELARAGKIVCFTNAEAEPLPMAKTSQGNRPPGFLESGRSDLAAFVQTPASRAFGLWFDEPEAPRKADWVISDRDTWEGLIVDLLATVRAYSNRT